MSKEQNEKPITDTQFINLLIDKLQFDPEVKNKSLEVLELQCVRETDVIMAQKKWLEHLEDVKIINIIGCITSICILFAVVVIACLK